MTKSQLPTPALLLDLDKFEFNLARMSETDREATGKRIRPHAKAHKCVEIARRQIGGAGAIGVCVATVSEAEMMAKAGIPGLLLTSPVADPLKMARIVETGAMAVVDHLQQVAWYQEAALANGVVDILVDLDVGDHRTGAATLEQALEIAEAVERTSHLRLRGLQAYSVYGSHGTGREERFRVSMETYARARAVRDAMARKGLCTDILTGGSTGTWDIDTDIPELTEIQAGSYVLMDMAYRRAGLDFEQAMTVLVTVISANHCRDLREH